MNVEESANVTDERIFRKLEESTFFQTYRQAFNDATGLQLSLTPATAKAEQEPACHYSSFCRELEGGIGGCQECQRVRTRLRRGAQERPETTTCFAGMRETLVPVRSGGRTFAMLGIGEVFTAEPGEELPAELNDVLARHGIEGERRDSLVEKWRETRVMAKGQYQGMVTIVAAFALQLSDVLNRLLTEEASAEPEVVVKAKRFVNAHLEEKFSLEHVAKHVGVSPYYFCKVFKQSAGMTLTEYVNRRRVEWAKRKLRDPRARVTEVAFDVGFQSISQFNRSFLKYVGESPTRYREHQGDVPSLKSAAA